MTAARNQRAGRPAGDAGFGDYAGSIRERVAACADYLGRISRQLEAVPSRRYVAEKATGLRDATVALVGGCHDVEGWLLACGEPVRQSYDDGEVCFEECALVLGHLGDHCGNPPRSPLQKARGLAEQAATAALAISDRLGWLSRSPGQAPGGWELVDLDGELWSLRRAVERLVAAVAALAGAGEQELEETLCPECEFEATSGPALAEHRRQTGH
jgi:hypothetical protein